MSMDPRFTDLMNHVIDGVASSEEAAELRAHLASHPQAQDELAGLKSLSGALGRVTAVEPPRGFKESVLEAISAGPARRKRESASALKVVRGPWMAGRSLIQYGSALAAGLLLGVAIARWGGPGTQDFGARPLDPSALAGTMTSRQTAFSAPILELPLESSGASGTVHVRQGEAGYVIDLDLDAPEAVQIELGYEPEKAAFRGFAQDIDAVQGLNVTRDTVSWSQSGHRRISVVMTPRTGSGTRVDLRVLSGGKAAGGRSLDLPALGQSQN